MNTTQLWFQQVDPADANGAKWHAADSVTSPSDGFHYRACCGFETSHASTVALDPGVLPVGDVEDAVCLHCQRALEMERRDQDIASAEGMPEPPEKDELEE